MLAKVVNADDDCLNIRGGLGSIASRLAPTVDCIGTVTSAGQRPVGAGLPAMGVNDDAFCLNVRGDFGFFRWQASSYEGHGSDEIMRMPGLEPRDHACFSPEIL